MALLKQSTNRSRAVFMVDSTDHVTGKTGLTLTITASKDAAAFASISPTVTELSSGWYKLALTTSHTDTLGDLAIHITGTGADPTDLVDQVVAFDPGVAYLTGSTVVETAGSYTTQQALSIILAAVAGRTSGSGLTFKTPDNSATRIVATVDTSNNRTGITLTPTA